MVEDRELGHGRDSCRRAQPPSRSSADRRAAAPRPRRRPPSSPPLERFLRDDRAPAAAPAPARNPWQRRRSAGGQRARPSRAPRRGATPRPGADPWTKPDRQSANTGQQAPTGDIATWSHPRWSRPSTVRRAARGRSRTPRSRERPRPRDPDPRARVRRLRQRGREVPRRRHDRGAEFISFRLKQGVYGQRQADVQMIRAKLPIGGITPEQIDVFADVVEKYAPLNKGHVTTRQNIQIHHIPLRDAAKADPRALRRRALQPRGLRQHRAQRHRRPVGRRDRRRAVRPHPLRRRLRALLRAPPDDAADAAQGQDRLQRPTDADRAITGIHDIAFLAARPRRRARLRGPRRRRHVDHAAHRADALRVRRAPTTASTSRSPRPSSASSTARSGCASTAPARASRSSSTSSASTSCAGRSRRSSRATGSPSATSPSTPLLFDDDEEAGAPGRAGRLRHARTATCREFERFAPPTCSRSARHGFSTVADQGHRAAT